MSLRSLRLVVLALAALASVPSARAQTPDARGEVKTETPSYRGVDANAPIPPEVHFHNEGGSDGAGLCVICSVVFDGLYQGVPGLDVPGRDERSGAMVGGKGSALWLAAKRAPGGYHPEKLAELVGRVMPGEQYASYLGSDYEVLKALSAKGYPVAVTMNTGSLYGYRPIAHMVSGVHFDDSYACIVDNNDPGRYYWMPKSEFLRRWMTGGVGWAWWWLRLPTVAQASMLTALAAIGACVLNMVNLILVDVARRRDVTPYMRG